LRFIEFEQWGWNAVSMSFIGTIIFGLIFGWGLYQQILTIKKSNSGKSIPMVMSVYFAFHFFAFSVYGFRIHSLAMMLNGTFGFLWLGIYVCASRKVDSDGRTNLEYLFALMPFIMALVPNPSVFLSIMLVTASFFLLDSPVEILRKKSAGSVEPKLLFCFMTSAVFWLIYSACISEWPLFTANVFGIVIMIITLVLWTKYKSPYQT